jgi:hypothetical protein
VCGWRLRKKRSSKQDRPPRSPLLTSQITYSCVDLRNHGHRACGHIWWIPPKDRVGILVCWDIGFEGTARLVALERSSLVELIVGGSLCWKRAFQSA